MQLDMARTAHDREKGSYDWHCGHTSPLNKHVFVEARKQPSELGLLLHTFFYPGIVHLNIPLVFYHQTTVQLHVDH